MTNKPINHQDWEDSLTAMVIGLKINYTKMESQMDFQEQLISKETILLVNSSMDNMMESWNSSMKKECYINIKNIPKEAVLLKSGD